MIAHNGCRRLLGPPEPPEPPTPPAPEPGSPGSVGIAPRGDGTVHVVTVGNGATRTLVLTRDGAAAVLERLALAVLAEFGIAVYAAAIAPAQRVVTARLNELIDRHGRLDDLDGADGAGGRAA